MTNVVDETYLRAHRTGGDCSPGTLSLGTKTTFNKERTVSNKPSQECVIRPFPPHDGNEWDCQCARCGSSCDYDNCWNCDDGGCGSDCIDDLCYGGECIHGDSGQIQCDICHGHGGWWVCLSGNDWCQANPIKGRENIMCGQIEWFQV